MSIISARQPRQSRLHRANSLHYDHYLRNIPNLHTWDGGQTWNSGGFDADRLEFLRITIEANTSQEHNALSIIETGAGNTTLLFLFMNPKSLISIAPDFELKSRIVNFCNDYAIGHEALSFIAARSEEVLPGLAKQYSEENHLLDVALIDGGHGWPTIFVDFCYLNSILRSGGLLILDDLQLHSVNEAARWLGMQPEYKLVAQLNKTVIFQKNTESRFFGDFGAQPYILQQTDRRLKLTDPCAFG